MTSGLVLALDIGTSSLRGCLFDKRGRQRRGTFIQVPCLPDAPEPRASVFDAEVFAERVESLIDVLSRTAGSAAIEAVAVSSFWHSLLGLDVHQRPVTPLLLWSDLRAADDAAALRQELDELAVHQRTGAVLHPTFWPSKLRWLARTQPRVFQSVCQWVSFADFLTLRWHGQARSSFSMASASGLFNRHSHTWDSEMLNASGVDIDALAPLRDLDQPSVGLTTAYSARWPKLVSARFLPAIGDGACSNVGVGAVGATNWAITVGTSAAVRAILDQPFAALPWGLWSYALDRDRPVVGGASNNGGNVYAWLQRTLRLPGSALLERALQMRRWGAHGLTVDPSLAGERSPNWPLNATGVIQGLTAQTSPIDIAQAMLEAVVSRIAEIAHLLETLTGPADRIIATGGAMVRSPAWASMLATALGRSVEASAIRESSLRGAALLALEQLESRMLGGSYAPHPRIAPAIVATPETMNSAAAES